MWMPSGDCRQFHLARVGNSSDAGHAVFEAPLAAFPPDVPLDIKTMPIHKQVRALQI